MIPWLFLLRSIERRSSIAGLSLPQSSPIVITSVSVPKHGVAGQGVVLGCNYRADSMVYSVRWYKNGKEFYRLAPRRYQNWHERRC